SNRLAHHAFFFETINRLESRELLAAVWPEFARDAQHTASSDVASLPLTQIRWSTPVDKAPQYTSGGDLLIHYGSPLVTTGGAVIIPVKTGATGGFAVESRQVDNGSLNWTVISDYLLPTYNWLPSYQPSLTPTGQLVLPAAGGTVLEIADADSTST